jgi:menaquinone-dependent protoporphyrinogen oxidase
MSVSVLVAYATKHGSTREVAEAIGEELVELGLDVEVAPAAEIDDMSGYDGIVLGGSLYTGRWHADALRFIERHASALREIPVAIFAMGPRTLQEHDVADARAQLDHSLAKVRDFEPAAVVIFGGVIVPERLRFPFNRMPASDARDWDAIRGWAGKVAKAVRESPQPGSAAARMA